MTHQPMEAATKQRKFTQKSTITERFFWPSKARWNRWGFLNKLGCVGSWASIIGIPLALLLFWLSSSEGPSNGHGDATRMSPKVENSGVMMNSPIVNTLGNSNTVTINITVVQEDLNKINREREAEFRKAYPLGYILFSFLHDEIVPFGSPDNRALFVHWERGEHWFKRQGSTLTLHMPDIEIGSNTLLHNTTVLLPAEPGAFLAMNIDPDFYTNGVAIAGNTFSGARGAVAKHQGDSVAPTTLAEAPKPPMENATMPPKTAVVIGNVFRSGEFDASGIPDGAIMAYNSVSAQAGVVQLGPHPKLSFVVQIVEGGAYSGPVVLFGLRRLDH